MKDTFVLGSRLIAGIECDLDDPNCFFLIDDYQDVYRIYVGKDGKGTVNSVISLAIHSL